MNGSAAVFLKEKLALKSLNAVDVKKENQPEIGTHGPIEKQPVLGPRTHDKRALPTAGGRVKCC